MVSETNVATAALAIAISALVIAAGQLIAQLFSTADGYRRCQPSVIGDWYKLVELKFRWSSFRYEVKVTTPHFLIEPILHHNKRVSFLLDQEKPLPKFPWSLYRVNSRYLVPSDYRVALLGTLESRLGTFCPDKVSQRALDSAGEDVPTWVTLLDDIHRGQSSTNTRFMTDDMLSEQWENYLAPICITRKTRSWDFMPPDIVRPVSSTTIGCLITMAYRLGMTWSDFRLDEGKMRASGSGRSFSTSIVRGMGLVVEYSGSTNIDSRNSESRMFSIAADKMTCGIIPIHGSQLWMGGYRDLHLRNTQSPSDLELKQPFSCLKINGDAKVALEASLLHKDPAQRLPGFTDIIGLWCDWIPLRNLPTNTIDNPFPFPLTTMGERPESRNVWRSELGKQVSLLSDARKLVLQFYDNWEVQSSKHFVSNYRVQTISDSQVAFFKKAFDDTTAYLDKCFEAVNADYYFLIYRILVRVHISINARSVEQAEENIKNNVARGTDSLPNNLDPVFKERAYIYADNIPKFVEEMERYDFNGPEKNISFEDIWWILMMRLHAWTMSVNWVDDRGGVKIPSEYYHSTARVYIL